MKNKRNTLDRWTKNGKAYILLLFLMTAFTAKAEVTDYEMMLTGTAISDGASLTTTATPPNNASIRYQEAQNYILLRINPEATNNVPNYTAKLDVNITYQDEAGNSTSVDNVILEVEHNNDAGAVHNDRDAYLFTGGHVVNVKINSAIFSNGANTDISNLQLVNYITVNRLYDFLNTAPTLSINGLTANKEINVTWNAITGAEEYQLEWLHVNNYDMTPTECQALTFNFRYNSTRITTTDLNYNISLVFEQGYVLFRIRALTLDETDLDLRIPGNWSADDMGTDPCTYTDQYPIQNNFIHEQDKFNWQYSASYAEEGKKKEVVTYFDGSLRSHQVVTRINTDQQTIVGETFYDHQGRAAVQALPAPTGFGIIAHYENFNRDQQNNQGYNRKHFDLSAGSCDLLADPMSTTVGASKYYSPNNPDANLGGHQAYVPDAQLYPFTHVEYEPDNTGRIRRQGGVGPTHQLGAHDTKYFYGKPSQEELNRLFGSEVGYNEHYKKNMVIDPNGQVSVSYMDQQGRTVATALAGNKPTNLEALTSNGTAENMTINILDNQPVQPGAEPLSSTYHHLVTTAGAHGLHYELGCVSDDFDTGGTFDETACLNCVYDIKIDIIGECGTSFYNHVEENITIDEICNSPYTVKVEIADNEINLPLGKYVISRTLQLNQQALQDNTEACIAGDSNILTWSDFHEANQPDLTQCEQPTCRSICKGLGSPEAIRECILDCEFGDPCGNQEEILYGDFVPTNAANTSFDLTDDTGAVTETITTPAGQYALYDVDETNGDITVSDLLSILHPSNSCYFAGIDSTAYIYTYTEIEEDGTETSVDVNIRVYNSAGQLVPPNELSLEEFINAYEPQWGQVFADCHPEICKVGICENNITSQRYDFLMTTTNSYTEAYALGLLNPLSMPSSNDVPAFPDMSPNADPFFAEIAAGIPLKPSMQGSLNNYPAINMNAWDLAAFAATGNQSNTFEFIADADACVRDRVWQIFRAIYLSEKMRLREANGDSNCNPVLGQGKISHFPEFEEVMDEFMTEVDNALNSNDPEGHFDNEGGLLDIQITAQCEERAAALADTWMQKLEGCAENVADWADAETFIRDGLKEVMLHTCGAEYSFGASTLPIDETTGESETTEENGYASFTHVLNEAVEEYGITIDLTCNADLITFPGAYGHEYASYTPSKPLDECACDAILESEQLFITEDNNNTLPTGVTTAEEFFEHTYEVQIDGYDAKVCLCKKALVAGGDNDGWSEGQVWPDPALAVLANSGEYIFADLSCQNCADCTKLVGDFNSYQNFWLNGADENTLTGEQLSNLHNMTANFLNNEFNLDLTYTEYAEFVEDCTTVGPDSPLCEKLTKEGEAFVATLNELAEEGTLTDVNCLCVEPFLEHYAPELAEVLNDDFNTTEYCHDIYTPTTISTRTMSIEVQSADPAIPPCNWTIFFINPLNGDFDGILPYLQNIRPAEDDLANTQAFWADVQVTIDNEVVDATIRVESDCYEIWECTTDPADMELCNHVFSIEDENNCEQDLIDAAINQATNLYNDYIKEITEDIENNYIEQCTPSDDTETFNMTFPDNEYHYTLYYYNQAGNLTRTVPPAGVELVPESDWGLVDAIRDAGQGKAVPGHRMSTRYKYNSLNQLTHQTMPDHDNMPGMEWSTRFFYDRLGRIVASQNSKQRAYDPERYSYTKYDELGRIVEAGELIWEQGLDPTQSVFVKPTTGMLNALNYPDNWSTDRVQVVKTHYDRPINDNIDDQFGDAGQENLRNRVASIIYQENLATGSSKYQSASHFSYDIHGNVKKLVQENRDLAHFIDGQQFKTMTYKYDLISGNVHQVNYQKGKPDQFFHRYEYDGDNRITKVETSPDGVIWDQDARYHYYEHGPLARTEIGDLRVQGCDFAYTIQGWIKGVNSNTLDPSRDIGRDGTQPVEERYAPDAYGYGLQYFNGDYKAIGGTTGDANTPYTNDFMAEITGTPLDAPNSDLFNGNISKMVTAISPVNGNDPVAIQGNAYTYDQLNRILSSNSFREFNENTNIDNVAINNTFKYASDNKDYNTQYTYDANGNILSLLRNGHIGSGQQEMDNLEYFYETGANGEPRNRLSYVIDDISSPQYDDEIYTDDIETQQAGNYKYDEIGNLTEDVAEEIKEIVWRVDGKVERVVREMGSDKPDLLFKYDPSGNRITKAVFHKNPAAGEPDVTYTHYVRDASGNTMAVYKREQELGNNATLTDYLTLNEQHLYGSSRLGLRSVDNILNNATFENLGLNLFGEYQPGTNTNNILSRWKPERSNRPLGAKNYELSNHLGNVLATVSDRKLWNGTARIADVKSASDYYPFGMEIGDRTMSLAGYRYGFNGKEKDPSGEWGSQAIYDYGFRIYNPGLGKFLSVDPIATSYPTLTPYQFASNRPINGSDLDGLEWKLEIYSPYISTKFTEAYTAKDLYDMRNWTNYAFTNGEFRDTYASRSYAEGVGNLDPIPQNTPIRLLYDEDKYAAGVTVQTYRFQTGKSASGVITKSNSYHFAPGGDLLGEYKDAGYPVDVRAFDSSEGKDFYGKQDFTGFYQGGGLILGGEGSHTGIMRGYIRGWGYFEFSTETTAEDSSTQMVGYSRGAIWGKYLGEGRLSPKSFVGEGTMSVAGGTLEGGRWTSVGDNGEITWKGLFRGVGIGLKGVLSQGPAETETKRTYPPVVRTSN